MNVNDDDSKCSEDEFTDSYFRSIKSVAEIRWAEDGHKNTISSSSRFSNFISSVQKRTVIFAALHPGHSRTTTKAATAEEKKHTNDLAVKSLAQLIHLAGVCSPKTFSTLRS